MELWLLGAWCGASALAAWGFHLVRSRLRPVTIPADVAEFLRALEADLATRHPQVGVVGMVAGRFTLVLTLHGQETPLPLQHLYRHWQAFPEALPRLVDQVLQEIEHGAIESPADHAFEDVALRLLPQLRATEWVRAQGQVFGEAALVHRRFCDDLAICYVIDDPWSMVFVSQAHLRQWGRREEDLFHLATNNLQRQAHGELPLPTDAEPIVVRTGDGYDATRLLLLDPDQAEGLCVAVPERDTLWIGNGTAPALAQLMQLTNQQNADAAHPVSPHLYRVQSGRLVPLAPEPS